MLKKVAIVLAATSLPLVASAELIIGAGYANISEDSEGVDVSLNALVASAGYKMPMNESFSLVPEIRLGFGIGDDSQALDYGLAELVDTKFELDSYYGFAVRGEFSTGNGLYLYAVPSITKTEVTATVPGAQIEASSDWEFGIGAGAGYQFSDFVAVDLGYEVIDDIDFLTVQGRFKF